MENYRIDLDMLSLRGARLENGNLIIPIATNGIRLAKSKRDETKMYATMAFHVHPRKTQGDHGEVAIVKPVMTIEEYNKWNAGEQVNVPIVGNLLIRKGGE